MSEHYDFHYQPTGSGAISGQQVLEQTEDAINELGDYVNDNVGGAMDVAQQALETAQTAETNAQTALDTANSFSGAIQTAQQDASTALSTAQTAQNTASNANNTAVQASQDASSAVTTANNASGQVNTLSGTVTALGQRVTTAEGNIGQNTSDITALTTRVGTAEGNITTLQNDVSIAQGNASSAMATAGTVKQQAYVFRYSSTVLTASSTNSNALLDNTDNLKVGDKVIDSSGVLFSITAIDTANSTFTVGSALIDLAQDSDVVHKSGDETVGGVKTFSDDIMLQGATTPVIKTISNIVQDTSGYNGSVSWVIRDRDNLNNILEYALYKYSAKAIDWQLKLTGINNGVSNTKGIRFTLDPVNNVANFTSIGNNSTSLGNSSTKWQSVYATNYYYGNDNVEFSTKFVTTDTAQTITGTKTFEGVDINLKSSIGDYGTTGDGLSVTYSDKNSVQLAQIKLGNYTSGISYQKFSIYAYDSNNQLIERTLTYSSSSTSFATAYFRPDNDNIVALGTSGNRWSKVYATNYYYGNDNVEFSTKFVTADTNQTISGTKTFAVSPIIYNPDTSVNDYLVLKNPKVAIGSTTDTGLQRILFQDKNGTSIGSLISSIDSNGWTYTTLEGCSLDSQSNVITRSVRLRVTNTAGALLPSNDNNISLGSASARWSDIRTVRVNNLEPSSLSLPDIDNRIDISSYITDLTGVNNEYTPTVNGWICVRSGNATKISILESATNIGNQSVSNTATYLTVMVPCIANKKVYINIVCISLSHAYFIPCQGNV